MFKKYKKLRWEVGIFWWGNPAALLLILILIYNGWNIKVAKINLEYTS